MQTIHDLQQQRYLLRAEIELKANTYPDGCSINWLSSRCEEKDSIVQFLRAIGYHIQKSSYAEADYIETTTGIFVYVNNRDMNRRGFIKRNSEAKIDKLVTPREFRKKTALPFFKYAPYIYKNDRITFKKAKCQCCGQKTDAYVNFMYCKEDVDCICLHCVADGKAAEKFNGEFVQEADMRIADADKRDDLFKRTPGYLSWQGDYWPACCNDFCTYIDSVGTKELEEMGIKEVAFADFKENYPDYYLPDFFYRNGSPCGYLFKCTHCGKYRLWLDFD